MRNLKSSSLGFPFVIFCTCMIHELIPPILSQSFFKKGVVHYFSCERRQCSLWMMFLLLVRILNLLLLSTLSFSFSIPPFNTPYRVDHNVTVPSLGVLNIHCWTQRPFPEKRLPRAEIADCYTALQGLLVGDKAMAPMHFTENERTGFKVPFAWGHDSCQIVINNLIPNAEDTFPIVLLAHLAAEVMEPCVMNSPAALGGDVKLGSHRQFEVLVAGTGLKDGSQDVTGGNTSDAATEAERRSLLGSLEVSP